MDDAAKQAEEELSNIAGKCLYLLNKMIKCFLTIMWSITICP